MHSGEWLIQYLYELRESGRANIKSIDLSYSKMPLNTLKSILRQMPNLKSLKIRGIAFEHFQVPAKFFEDVSGVKSLDISGNFLEKVLEGNIDLRTSYQFDMIYIT